MSILYKELKLCYTIPYILEGLDKPFYKNENFQSSRILLWRKLDEK